MTRDDLIDRLANENEEFRRLREEHRGTIASSRG